MCENPLCRKSLSRLVNLFFPGLTLRHRNTVTWTCDWHARFSLIYNFITIDTTPFCNCKFGAQSRRLSFSQPWCFFFDGLPFALLVLELLLALFSLVICCESSPFIWPFGPSIWLPQLLPTGVAAGQSLGP